MDHDAKSLVPSVNIDGLHDKSSKEVRDMKELSGGARGLLTVSCADAALHGLHLLPPVVGRRLLGITSHHMTWSSSRRCSRQ